jgi:hypothetical protein
MFEETPDVMNRQLLLAQTEICQSVFQILCFLIGHKKLKKPKRLFNHPLLKSNCIIYAEENHFNHRFSIFSHVSSPPGHLTFEDFTKKVDSINMSNSGAPQTTLQSALDGFTRAKNLLVELKQQEEAKKLNSFVQQEYIQVKYLNIQLCKYGL